MKLTVTLSGNFNLDDGDIRALQEDLEDAARLDYGGKGVVVEVVRG